MPRRYQRQIDRITNEIISLGTTVEEQLKQALVVLNGGDVSLVEKIFETDSDIDNREVEIEEECLKVLALYQPVANDLRFIVAVLKINNDLERIGDLAVNIAKRSRKLSALEPIDKPEDIAHLAKVATLMLKKCLLSLIEKDVEIAKGVIEADDEVDEKNRQMHKSTIELIKSEPQFSEQRLLLLSVSRHLERIADLACNVAEDVIYMLDGTIVRHGRGELA